MWFTIWRFVAFCNCFVLGIFVHAPIYIELFPDMIYFHCILFFIACWLHIGTKYISVSGLHDYIAFRFPMAGVAQKVDIMKPRVYTFVFWRKLYLSFEITLVFHSSSPHAQSVKLTCLIMWCLSILYCPFRCYHSSKKVVLYRWSPLPR